jgi:hypothetical protein
MIRGISDEMENDAPQRKYVERFQKSLEDHPLPDFEAVEKYFNPSGGFMTADETGYHFLIFNMRADD